MIYLSLNLSTLLPVVIRRGQIPGLRLVFEAWVNTHTLDDLDILFIVHAGGVIGYRSIDLENPISFLRCVDQAFQNVQREIYGRTRSRVKTYR